METSPLPKLENATHITGTAFESSGGKVTVQKTYFVYVLRSIQNKKFFIGTTNDLYSCLERHNTGKNIHTVDLYPFELIYYEAYIYFQDAFNRERYLRSTAGQKFLKKNLQRYFQADRTSAFRKILRVVPYVSVFVLILLGPALVALYMTPSSSFAAWFNEAWAYRKSLTITHNAALTNQKIKFDIDTQTLITNGQMQSDCGDSRFTDGNGNLLPYFIDTTGGACNTSSTDYYVYFPIVNNGTTIIYHYYGNSSAPNGTKNSQLIYPTLTPSGGAASAGSEETGPGPIVYWKMDEGANTTVYDSSSKQNTGTIIGGTWKSSENCISGTCLFVNDTSNQGIVADPTVLNKLTTGTISVWARYTGANAFQGIFNIFRNADTNTTGVALSFDNQLSGGVNILGGGYQDGSTKWEFTVSSSDFNAVTEIDKWHLYTLAHNGTTPILYIDGKVIPITFTTSTDKTLWFKGILTDASSPADTLSMGILYANNTPFYNATAAFDEFKIYPYTRSSSQIAADFISRGSTKGTSVTIGNQETKNLTESLVGYWNMDDTWSGNTGFLPAVTGGSAGLTGDYYDGINFDTYVNSYTDSTVDFDPADTTLGTNRANGDNTFSVQWTGEVKASFSETYTFYVTSDDGARLSVNNSQLINAWIDQGPTENSGTIALTANTWYPISLNFYENGGGSAIQLSYSSASEAKKIIPSTNLRTVARSAGACSSTPSGPTDYSGNSNDLTHNSCNPAPNYNGKFNFSGKFTRSIGTFNSGNDSSSLSITGDLTLAAWIKPNFATPSSQMDIAGKWDGSNQSYLLAQYGSEARLYLDSATNYITSSGAGIIPNTWNYVVGTYNASRNEAKIFVNGREQATTLSGVIPTVIGDDSSVFSLGAEDTSTTATNAFDGYIDDVRVYKRQLSPAEVRQLYFWAPGPIGWWKFDENIGSSFYDSSGNDRENGVIEDETAKWVVGKYGSAINFAGNNSNKGYIPNTDTILNTMGVKKQSYTLETWVKPSNADSGSYIVIKGQNSWGNGNIEYGISSELSGGKLYAGFEILDGTNWPSVGGSGISTSTMPVNTWTHVVGVRDAEKQTLRLYVNGVLVDEQADTTTDTTANTESLQFGNRPGSDTPFAGALDDVKLYDYARSPSQIIEDMNGGHPIGGSPIGSQLIYAKMDEQTGTTINNSGSGGSTYNGSSTGITWLENTRCKVNGCLNFDTTSDTVSFGTASFIDNIASISASLWIYPRSAATNAMIVSKANTTTQRVFQIKTDNSSASELKVMIAASASDTTNFCTTSGLGLAVNTWQHISIVFDGGQTNNNNKVTVYKNGRPYICSGTLPNALVSGTTSLLKLGKGDDSTPNSFIGFIDEFKFYNYALTNDTVLIDYNQGASLNFNTGSSLEASQSADTAGNPPVGYWNFDENKDNTCTGGSADVCDKSGNGFDLTNAANTKWVVGKFGSALNFAGAATDKTTYNDVGASALDIAGSFTVQAWVKLTNLSTDFQTIVVKHTSSTSGANYGLTTGATALTGRDEIDCAFNDGGSNPSLDTTSANLVPNRWYLITCVFNTTANTLTIYVNGVQSLQSTGVTTDPQTGDQDLFIGNDAANLYGNPLNGSVDEVKIYNYARTAAQVAYDYNRGGPIGWWKFDECQGSTLYDASGNSNNQTWNGSGSGSQTSVGTCNTSSTAWGNGVTGKFNASLNFDGTNDYTTVSDNSFLNPPTSMTLSLWMKASSFSGGGNFLCSKENSTPGGYGIYTTSNQLYSYVRVGSSWSEATGVTLNTGQWYHIVMSYDGTIHKQYINGNLRATDSTAGTITSSTGSFTCGRDYNATNYFSGQIDDVRLYNYPLSASQVQKVYNDGSSVFFGPSTGSP